MDVNAYTRLFSAALTTSCVTGKVAGGGPLGWDQNAPPVIVASHPFMARWKAEYGYDGPTRSPAPLRADFRWSPPAEGEPGEGGRDDDRGGSVGE
ncbi:hypothetical protein GCM10023191_100760 [Actinoallomurus oryzae]|uniref:Uncharacterized protein n=1 Tax=Actinoallomurus oryzae TaxID=502180 RepID=A0ABP8R9G1_9ACTN